MDLKVKLEGLQRRMNISDLIGATIEEVKEYESELKEIVLVGEWLKDECCKINKIYRDTSEHTDWYVMLSNNTGLNFRYLKVKINLHKDGIQIMVLDAIIEDLYHNSVGKLYLSHEIRDGSLLSVVVGSIDYELM